MLDAEALDDAGRPTLTITGIREFLDRARAHGAHVPLLYLPRWYWERLGSPDLRGLPPLWASRYVAGDSGPASVMYQRHHPAGWQPYGGLTVEVLQFTDRALVAGTKVDANHYRGTRAQLAALISTPEDTMPTPAEVWDHVIPDPYPHAEPKRARDLLGWAATHAAHASEEARAVQGELAALKAALPTMVAEEVRAVLAESVVDVDVTVQNRTTDPAHA